MKVYECPIRATLDIIGGKWKPVILYLLMNRTRRFNELKRNIEEISNKSLTQHLRELEEDGVIHREVYPDEMPLRVEYQLTEFGQTLVPILKAMAQWGCQNRVVANRQPEVEQPRTSPHAAG